MTSKIVFVLALVAGLGVAGPAGTDVWDSGDSNFLTDNNPDDTRNQITHGLSQVHDLGVQAGPLPDQDWYRISEEPFSSYEVVCDGFSGDVPGVVANLQRVDGTGTVLQNGVMYGSAGGYPETLSFANDTSTTITLEYIRVANANCGTSCNTTNQYRIRAWETTIAVPRYNNAGGQLTVLIIQNAGWRTVAGNARLWTTAGGTVPVTTVPFTLQTRQAAVINLASVNGGVANGTSGTITITHDGSYGQLAVKAVALEPSTGFSFDTPGLYKPVS